MKKQTHKRWSSKEILLVQACNPIDRTQVKQLQNTLGRSRSSILSKHYALKRNPPKQRFNLEKWIPTVKKSVTLSNFTSININGNSITITF